MKLAWLLQPALSAWILQGASLDEAAAEQGLLAEEESSCRNGREDCSLQLLQRQASAFAGEPLDSDLDDDTVAQASAKEEGCSQADAQAIFSRGFGVGPESLPSQVMNCTQTSWGVWDMQEGKFNTCMKPLSKSCSKCFMSLGSRRWADCKRVCTYRRWCEDVCSDCLGVAIANIQACAKIQMPYLPRCSE
eukprot:TRINITY_DN4282_c0_g1_i1.p1 TRINITY_DN4282_c0_g1~~TRINITY_DN4282_c0_g1_i1.p1  ORF type:complete len:191 (-),score=47.00 TRINITY_DN4282_c0_g1_i1:339-911(-)